MSVHTHPTLPFKRNNSDESELIVPGYYQNVPHLSLTPPFPLHPFIHHEYFCSLALVTHLVSMTNPAIPVELHVLFADNGEEVDVSTVLDVVANGVSEIGGTSANPVFVISGSMFLDFKIVFKQLSRNVANRQFVFQARVKEGSAKLLKLELINNYASAPLTVVQHRLVVTSPGPQDALWYKDEGGRENWIVVSGVLRDANDCVVKNKEFPLTISIGYAHSFETLEDQTILRLQNNLNLVDAQGHFEFRYRIEDVSKNHKKQSFVLFVRPGSAPMFNDVAPGVTDPLNVKSKRNKRPKKGNDLNNSAPPSPVNISTHHADLLMSIRKPESPPKPRLLPSLNPSLPADHSITSVQNCMMWMVDFEKKIYEVNQLIHTYKTEIEPNLAHFAHAYSVQQGAVFESYNNNPSNPPHLSLNKSIMPRDEVPLDINSTLPPYMPNFQPTLSRLFSSEYRPPPLFLSEISQNPTGLNNLSSLQK